MKSILFLLLFPVVVFAQEPAKQLKFSTLHQSYFSGSKSVSPDGKKLLVTFWKDQLNSFELIDLINLKLISSGNLPDRVLSFAWSEDAALVALEMIHIPPQCFDTRNGFKKVFACRQEGAVAFSRKALLAGKQEEYLVLFNEDYVYRYTRSGTLSDSVATGNFEMYSHAWFDILGKNYCSLTDIGNELITFSEKGERLESFPLENISLPVTQQPDKNGSLFLYGDDKKMIVFDVFTKKKKLAITRPKIYAACFTADSKSILLKTEDGFEKINMQTGQSAVVKIRGYYGFIMPVAFGSELLCVNPDGIAVYACKDYLPQLPQLASPAVKEKPAPVVNNPVVKTNPPVTTVPAKWTLPYKLTDFITPFQKDSFYLYSADRAIRYYIVYSKGEDGILWSNAYNYFQYFGFSKETRFAQVSTYILDITDSSARLGSYAKSGLVEKPMMIGGQNFLGKLPSAGKKDITWNNDMYGEKASWTAKLIDNVYKGKKGKCLLVSRKETSNGQQVDETYYYQQGVGLIKIESGGKVHVERL